MPEWDHHNHPTIIAGDQQKRDVWSFLRDNLVPLGVIGAFCVFIWGCAIAWGTKADKTEIKELSKRVLLLEKENATLKVKIYYLEAR